MTSAQISEALHRTAKMYAEIEKFVVNEGRNLGRLNRVGAAELHNEIKAHKIRS